MKEQQRPLREPANHEKPAALNADSSQARASATPRSVIQQVGELIRKRRAVLRVLWLPLGVVGLMAGASLFFRMHGAPPTPSLKEFLAANPNCAEATDQCRTCLIFSASEVSCSVIGIACQPKSWTCRERTVSHQFRFTNRDRPTAEAK